MLACSKWKMRIKKFLLVVPLLLGIFFVSDTSAFAEETSGFGANVIQGKSFIQRDAKVDFPIKLRYEAREAYIEFASPVDIAGYSYLFKEMQSDVTIMFYTKNNGTYSDVFTSKSPIFDTRKLDLKSVYKVSVNASSYNGSILSNLAVYEKIQLPPNDVSDIKEEVVTHNSVKLTYKFPKDNFGSVKVFRDGKVIADAVKTEYFTDKDLQPETEYTYKFVSVSPTGKQESKGIEYKVKTEKAPDLTKPSKPSSPILTPKDGSLIVNLTNYNAGVKIKGYHIIVDGKQVNESLVTARSYAVKGLKNGQTYQVQIKSVSAWNVESDLSNSIPGMPQVQVIPDIAFNFGLTDLVEAIKNWFGGIWPIIAFSIAIPLAFIVAFNTKKLFLR